VTQAIVTQYKSPLHQMAMTTVTDYWNDSCSVAELTYAIERGAVGATSNPTIVLNVIKKEMHLWRERIAQIIAKNPTWSEVDITWKIFEEVGVKGAQLLQPVFERENGLKGRLSIQTNPAFYRNSDAVVEQAIHFGNLAPNMQVKIPVTSAGIDAIEEATYQGVNINATVCFSVPQALAVAEAVERGLDRRQKESLDTAKMTPVCTIMVGRTDDWMKIYARREEILMLPGSMDWAGIACFKKAYQLYKQRGYQARLLAAAYRHHLHWTELVGGDVILTIPYDWQVLFNASGFEVIERIQEPVPPEIVDTLYERLPEFRKAYDVDGLTLPEFDAYGATVRTLRGFTASFYDLVAIIRNYMLPDPDVKQTHG
jgi:transaldolase